jgi:hypothetical protein
MTRPRGTCTFKGCQGRRVVTFQVSWHLAKDAVPNYSGLASEAFTIAPCFAHAGELAGMTDPASILRISRTLADYHESQKEKPTDEVHAAERT